MEKYQQAKAELHEEIIALKHEAAELKACRKVTPKHVTVADLPREDRFRQLAQSTLYPQWPAALVHSG